MQKIEDLIEEFKTMQPTIKIHNLKITTNETSLIINAIRKNQVANVLEVKDIDHVLLKAIIFAVLGHKNINHLILDYIPNIETSTVNSFTKLSNIKHYTLTSYPEDALKNLLENLITPQSACETLTIDTLTENTVTFLKNKLNESKIKNLNISISADAKAINQLKSFCSNTIKLDFSNATINKETIPVAKEVEEEIIDEMDRSDDESDIINSIKEIEPKPRKKLRHHKPDNDQHDDMEIEKEETKKIHHSTITSTEMETSKINDKKATTSDDNNRIEKYTTSFFTEFENIITSSEHLDFERRSELLVELAEQMTLNQLLKEEIATLQRIASYSKTTTEIFMNKGLQFSSNTDKKDTAKTEDNNNLNSLKI